MPRSKPPYDIRVRLVLIGLVAGFFSALFGVGGGIVIVPLLLLLCSWDARHATATSLAAIGVTALSGVVAYWFHGEIRPAYAALVGLPAAVGAVGVVLGVAAGVLAGIFGVGGGILFVPILVALGLSHHDATGTSLLAILPTVAAGTWRQSRYGNVRWKAALVVGLAAAAAAQGGVALAEALADRTLRRLFSRP